MISGTFFMNLPTKETSEAKSSYFINYTVGELIDLNPKRRHDLTIEEVRACPWFANFTDEQAQEVIRTLKEFTLIMYRHYRKQKQK
jgi:hypothetical protein